MTNWGLFHRDIWFLIIRADPLLCNTLSRTNKSLRALMVNNADEWIDAAIHQQAANLECITIKRRQPYMRFSGIGAISLGEIEAESRRRGLSSGQVICEVRLLVARALLVVRSRACKDHNLLDAISKYTYIHTRRFYFTDVASHLYVEKYDSEWVVPQTHIPSASYHLQRWLERQYVHVKNAEARRQKSYEMWLRLHRL